MTQPHHLLQNACVPYYAYRISLTKQVIHKCVVALDVFSLRQQRKATHSLGKKWSTHLSCVHVLHYLLPDPALPLQNFICSGHRINRLISLFSPLCIFTSPKSHAECSIIHLVGGSSMAIFTSKSCIYLRRYSGGRQSYYPLMYEKPTAMLT